MTSNTYIHCFKSLKKVQKPLRYRILMVFSWLGRPSMGCGTSWTCPNGSPFVDSWLTTYIPQCQIHFPERYFGWTHDTTFGWIWSWYHQIWTGRRGDKPPRLHVDILQSLFKQFPQLVLCRLGLEARSQAKPGHGFRATGQANCLASYGLCIWKQSNDK